MRAKVIILFLLSILAPLHPITQSTYFQQYDLAQVSTKEADKPVFLPIIVGDVSGYFVSLSGSDTNPGTEQRPLKTIGKAASLARAGDTVYIRGGVYTEAVSINNSGTVDKPIKFLAYPGETPIIDGNNRIPGTGGYLINMNGNYLYVSGIEVRNSAYGGIYVYGSFNVVDNMFVHHTKAGGVLIGHGQHSTVQNSRVWRAGLSNEYGHGGTGISAARNGVTYATIQNNEVWEVWGEGISSYEANQVVIEGNISHDNYTTNIYISDSTNVLCRGNFVYMNPNSYVYDYGDNVGIMLGDERYTPASANIQVVNNIAYGNSVNFWWWQGVQGGGMNNVLIANNTFVNVPSGITTGRGNVTISRGTHVNVRFINNMVQQEGTVPVIATISQPGITYSHNLWSKTPYSAASGTGDVIGDPLFSHSGGTSFASAWYKLTSGSPAINKAVSLPEVPFDYEGSPRGNSPDMGSMEYSQ